MELSGRMKAYEAVTDIQCTRRMPLVIRLDGCHFHSWIRINSIKKPFDPILHTCFMTAIQKTCAAITGAVFAYTQSDEVSILVQDWYGLQTDPWYQKRVQKIVSVTASIFTLAFCAAADPAWTPAIFDARVFVVPLEDVCNYFIWRQQDAERNSIQSVGQHYFSQSVLHKKTNKQVQALLWEIHGVNWATYPIWQKRGACTYQRAQWMQDDVPPVFARDRKYVEAWLQP